MASLRFIFKDEALFSMVVAYFGLFHASPGSESTCNALLGPGAWPGGNSP